MSYQWIPPMSALWPSSSSWEELGVGMGVGVRVGVGLGFFGGGGGVPVRLPPVFEKSLRMLLQKNIDNKIFFTHSRGGIALEPNHGN